MINCAKVISFWDTLFYQEIIKHKIQIYRVYFHQTRRQRTLTLKKFRKNNKSNHFGIDINKCTINSFFCNQMHHKYKQMKKLLKQHLTVHITRRSLKMYYLLYKVPNI